MEKKTDPEQTATLRHLSDVLESLNRSSTFTGILAVVLFFVTIEQTFFTSVQCFILLGDDPQTAVFRAMGVILFFMGLAVLGVYLIFKSRFTRKGAKLPESPQ